MVKVTVKVFLLLMAVVSVFGYPERKSLESGRRFVRSPSPGHGHGHYDDHRDFDHHRGHDYYQGHDYNYGHGHHGRSGHDRHNEYRGDIGHGSAGHHGNYDRIQPYPSLLGGNSRTQSSAIASSGSISTPFGSGSYASSKSNSGSDSYF